MKSQKGITLIALIITIIVMLILVGVTVAVVLNGGLFGTAKKAASDTQIEADKEILQSAIIAATNTDTLIIPNAGALLNNLPDGWSVTGTGPYTCTSPKENVFKVTNDGKITVKTTNNLSDLEKYILGEDGEGRDFMGEDGIFDGNSMLDEAPITGVQMLNTANNGLNSAGEYVIIVYITYDGSVYRFEVDQGYDEEDNETYVTNGDYGVVAVNMPDTNSRVGKYVNFDANNDGIIANDGSELYIVIYDDETHGTQIMSANALQVNNSYVYLGSQDTTVTASEIAAVDTAIGLTSEQKAALSSNMQTNLTNLEKSIASYNKAIITLNNACDGLVNDNISYVSSVRSVGSNPTSKNSENTTPYESDKLEIWPLSTSSYSHLTGRLNGIGYSTDNNYEEDFDRMLVTGIAMSENENSYWLASRVVYGYSDDVHFRMRYVDSDGSCSDTYLWRVSDDSAYVSSDGNRVRPVVSLSSSVQFTGEGTKASPYTISANS